MIFSIRKMIEQTLQQTFGFDQFRPGQAQAISKVVEGNSVAAIFPTGSGKSLCYQLTALLLPHLTLVVSPLLALMKDQLSFLAQKGIPAASIDSSLTREQSQQVMSQVRQGQLKILMISVERFKNERFREFLKQVPISLLVVDEAHCISEWGHNFRPDYLQLPQFAAQFNIPQSLLLTATATPKVIKDMQQKFAIADVNVVLTGFYRENLYLTVEPVTLEQRDAALKYWLQQFTGQSGIVYVTLQKTAEIVAKQLQSSGLNAKAYHAGLDNDTKQHIQQAFMNGDIPCIVATIAFGMGIDKSDIRYVLHYDLPKSIENYSQEIGRAGRDGGPGTCVVLANADSLNVLENFVYGDTPEPEGISAVLSDIQNQQSDDNQWETQLLRLSNQCNIKQLPLKTLLVNLQLNHTLESLYSYFADYRFKLQLSESDLINTFNGERQQFVTALLSTSNKARTWYTVNFDELYRQYGAPRDRAIAALDYFNDKQFIELESKQMTDVYRVLNPRFDATSLAQQLYLYFKSKEQSEIERIHHMIGFFQSSHCLSQTLAHHFGDHQLTSPCGHCSVCEGKVATLPTSTQLAPLQPQAVVQLCGEFIAACPTPPSAELTARFLCGLSVPLFTKIKARKMAGFGRLENYRYQDVVDCVRQK